MAYTVLFKRIYLNNLYLFSIIVLCMFLAISSWRSIGRVQMPTHSILSSFKGIPDQSNHKIFHQSRKILHAEKGRPEYLDIEDVLLSGLNKKQDVSVKVLSCREAVQEAMNRRKMSPLAAQALGETMACSLLMGSGLKGEETLQVNLVGTNGIKNVMTITDGSLKVRGMVGEPEFSSDDSTTKSCGSLLGQGQIQVVRNHPTWKHSMNGIVSLVDTDIATNLALYLTESEQRSAVLLSDVRISHDNKCEHAMALLVESLPGIVEGTLEKCIVNVQKVHSKSLSSYLSNLQSSSSSQSFIPVGPVSLRMEEVLHYILDDCFEGLDETEGPRGEGIRFSKTPQYECRCNIDRVFNAISLLPKQDIDEIIEEGKDVDSTCNFCGKQYSVSVEDLTKRLLDPNYKSKNS